MVNDEKKFVGIFLKFFQRRNFGKRKCEFFGVFDMKICKKFTEKCKNQSVSINLT